MTRPSTPSKTRVSILYAQSSALVHYLTLGSEARNGQLDRLAGGLLYARRPVKAAIEEAFGDLAALEEELRAYIHNKAFAYQQGPATVAPDTQDFTVRPLSTAESLAVRAAFHVATNRPVEATALAEQALAEEPNLAAAHEALALVAWREARIAEATETLARATRLPGASDFAYYLSGRLRWQQATGPKALDEAERSFMRAIERNPRFAAAYHDVARFRDSRGAPVNRSLPPAMRASLIEQATSTT